MKKVIGMPRRNITKIQSIGEFIQDWYFIKPMKSKCRDIRTFRERPRVLRKCWIMEYLHSGSEDSEEKHKASVFFKKEL